MRMMRLGILCLGVIVCVGCGQATKITEATSPTTPVLLGQFPHRDDSGLLTNQADFVALNPQGQPLWHTTANVTYTPPTVANGIIYQVQRQTDGHDSLVAVDLARGTLRWQATTDGTASANTPGRSDGDAIFVADGRVFMGITEVDKRPQEIGSTIFAFDAATGKALWRYHTPLHAGIALAQDGTVFAIEKPTSPYCASTITALNAADGAPRWHFTKTGFTNRTVADGQHLYLTSYYDACDSNLRLGSLTALRLSDGQQAWKQSLDSVPSAPNLLGNVVYFAAFDRDRASYQTISSFRATDGMPQWSYPFRGTNSALLTDGQRIIVALNLRDGGERVTQSLLVALTPATGTEAWRVVLPKQSYNDDSPGGVGTPALVEGHIVTMGHTFDATGLLNPTDETVFAYDAAKGGAGWRAPISGTGSISQLVTTHSTVYVRSQARAANDARGIDTITALRVSDGKLLWHSEEPGINVFFALP